VVAKRFFIR